MTILHVMGEGYCIKWNCARERYYGEFDPEDYSYLYQPYYTKNLYFRLLKIFIG
jgi:hypothetical protein